MQDWHPEDIKAKVRKQGASLSALARKGGMSPQSVAMVLVRPGRKGEQVIAEFLGVAPYRIWPSRYHADGTRKRPQPPENYRREPRFTGAETAA